MSENDPEYHDLSYAEYRNEKFDYEGYTFNTITYLKDDKYLVYVSYRPAEKDTDKKFKLLVINNNKPFFEVSSENVNDNKGNTKDYFDKKYSEIKNDIESLVDNGKIELE